jgi:uncharacterized membrane protein
MAFYFPIILTALATAVYHIAQKSIAPSANPLVSLAMTYLTALGVSVAGILATPGGRSLVGSLRQLNWATYVVGVSIFGVELAVLLAYRAGWRISLASVVANVASALLLVVVGVLFYREHLALKHVTGLVLCLAGLTLLAQR